MPNIFEPREHFKPFEYPELIQYVDAINHSYWLFTEFNFTEDIQQYHTKLGDKERELIKRCLLGISQVEVSVKLFFLKLIDHLPKPEFLAVGATFSESEVRHERAYSHLLEILGLNNEFEKMYEIPAILDRHNYLKKYKDFSNARLPENYLKSLVLFTLFIENVSLFSQFYIIMSFNKKRKLLKDINNAVAATSKEEAIHASCGMYIIKKIREEQPDLFTEELKDEVIQYTRKALVAEQKMLDWFFELGGPEFLSKEEVLNFVKGRFNESLKGIDMDFSFETDKQMDRKNKWFYESLYSDEHVDFFNQRPISYSKKTKSITENDLF